MTAVHPASPPRGRRRRTARVGIAVALAVAVLTAPVAAYAEDDPSLDQQLQDLSITHGERVLDAGHVDMGPKFDGGEWRFLIHDDVARADANTESVWRYPDETVFHVVDQAQLPMPEDPAYSFVGADPGANVWVVPQTQADDVVWLGWNTQDPEVMQTIDRGVTLSLTGVQGPGTVTMYLQSGSFDPPELLWDSRISEPQPLWVDVNTHTHANWVFTEPGVYLLQLEAAADLLDGSTVTDTQIIRFAVGTATAPADVFAATWAGDATPNDALPGDSEQPSDGPVSAEPEPAADPLVPILIGVIVLVAAGLIAWFTVVILHGNRAKNKALASLRAGENVPDPVEGDTE